MKALILHANQWLVRVESPSQRIGDCEPETLRSKEERMEECLAVLFHIEKGDSSREAELLCRDIKQIAEKVVTNRLMISGFAHLSHSRPDLKVAKQLFLQVVETFQNWTTYEVRSSHFGYNKSLLLDVKGHANAFSFRSYDPPSTWEPKKVSKIAWVRKGARKLYRNIFRQNKKENSHVPA